MAIVFLCVIAVQRLMANDIFEAIKKNDIQLVQKIIGEDKSQIGVKDEFGNTPLHCAVFSGHIKIVELLLKCGAKVNAQDDGGLTPLFLSLFFPGNLEAFGLLLDYGADVNARGKHYKTPLYVAAFFGRMKAVKLLLDRGALVDAKDVSGVTPLHCMMIAGGEKDADIPDAFFMLGNLRITWDKGVFAGQYEEVAELLIKHGAKINLRGNDRETLLHLAVANGNIRIAKLFLEHKAEVNAIDGFRNTPLHYAALFGHEEIAKLLLENAAEVDSKNDGGSTALHLAVRDGKREKVVRLLLDSGGDVNAKDCAGLTPFYYAVHTVCKERLLSLELLRLLIEYGAALNESGFSEDAFPICCAAEWRGCEDIVEFLLVSGASLGERCCSFVSLLRAFESGNKSLIRLFLNYGIMQKAHKNDREAWLDFLRDNSEAEISCYFVKLMRQKKKLGELLYLLKTNKNQNVIEKFDEYIFDENVLERFKAKAIAGLIKFSKNNGHLINRLKIRDYIKHIPFKLYVLEIDAITRFALCNKNLNITDMHDKRIEDALCLYPMSNSIPFVFDSEPSLCWMEDYKKNEELFPKNHFIHKMLNEAKKWKKKRCLHNFFDRKFLTCLMNHNVVLPKEIIGEVMSFVNSDLDLARLIRERGAETDIFGAIEKNDIRLVQKITGENKSLVNIQNEIGDTPLHCAAAFGRIEIVALLLDRGAKIDAKNDRGNTPLHCAAGCGHTEIIELLLKNGAALCEKNRLGLCPINYAISKGQTKTVSWLLEKDIWQRHTYSWSKHSRGRNPIFYAVLNGHLEMVKLLGGFSGSGELFCLAAGMGHEDIVQWFLANGGNVNAAGLGGNVPLHCSAGEGRESMVRLLLANGAAINAVNKEGNTPLHCATRENRESVVQLLLERGAEVNVENNRGKTPRHWAKEEKLKRISHLFYKRYLSEIKKIDRRNNPFSPSEAAIIREVLQSMAKEKEEAKRKALEQKKREGKK